MKTLKTLLLMYGNMYLTNDIFIQSFNQFGERIEYAGESGTVAVF